MEMMKEMKEMLMQEVKNVSCIYIKFYIHVGLNYPKLMTNFIVGLVYCALLWFKQVHKT